MTRLETSLRTASPRASTESAQRAAFLTAAGLLAVLVAGRASAHDITSHAVRELVRIQGQLGTATVPPNGRQVTFVIRGQRLPFTATEWRIFAFADDTTLKQPEAPEPELVGDRPLLRRVITARPDQLITILAERRPGSSDLFVLAVDRCPDR
jgi:hypothetical protein